MPRPATALLPELWTLSEVHELTGRSIRELQDAAAADAFDHYLIGRTRLMSMPQIEEMVASFLRQRQTPGPRRPQKAVARARNRVIAARERAASKAA